MAASQMSAVQRYYWRAYPVGWSAPTLSDAVSAGDAGSAGTVCGRSAAGDPGAVTSGTAIIGRRAGPRLGRVSRGCSGGEVDHNLAVADAPRGPEGRQQRHGPVVAGGDLGAYA